MAKALVIVESPTKARTIKKYLGKNYKVIATVGHVKDLPENEIGVDIKNGFQPTYSTIPGKEKILNKLKHEGNNATIIYLAQDPDREGEAIAWHTGEILEKKGKKIVRVLFYELTKEAIKKSILNSQPLDLYKYKAQQTRRILDRLVGYQVSPILWNKIKTGLSAGRVQSVSVKIICEREKKIQKFIPKEHWSIHARLQHKSERPFFSKITQKNNKKILISNKKHVKLILKQLSSSKFILNKIIKRTQKTHPPPPFTTSKLQQQAIKKLKFSAKKTMIIAQQLYEGIDIEPENPTGLISYMRTDSTRISTKMSKQGINYIKSFYGNEYATEKLKIYKSKKKIQNAHEAIRPTSILNTPKKIKPYLSNDQFKLYILIWNRFLASLMKPKITSQNKIQVKAKNYIFVASNSSIKFLGFMILYKNEIKKRKNSKINQILPSFNKNDILKLISTIPKQYLTKPPHRFSEASLVKELEENGIGRPSTYVAILSNIREKGYVYMYRKCFRPTEIGFIVNNLLINSFPKIIDVEFTANMENNLDLIEHAKADSLDILTNFYTAFEKKLKIAKDSMPNIKEIGVPTPLKCPNCHTKLLKIKIGKNGHFITCNEYPECNYSNSYKRNKRGEIISFSNLNRTKIDLIECNLCKSPMTIKHGKYGKFIACTGYPKCKNTSSIIKIISDKNLGIKCPETNCTGKIIIKSLQKEKTFYGCNHFPICRFAVWYEPINKTCPKCNSPYLIKKTTKKHSTITVCPSYVCQYFEKPLKIPK